jgi:hypothetical protein
VQHERRRHRVEQLGVVDGDDHLAAAPRGTAAALRVACTHAVSAPSRSAAASASRASRDLPAPGPAMTTTPWQCSSARAAAMPASSASRPTSGQSVGNGAGEVRSAIWVRANST